jgi:hypothetical protein
VTHFLLHQKDEFSCFAVRRNHARDESSICAEESMQKEDVRSVGTEARMAEKMAGGICAGIASNSAVRRALIPDQAARVRPPIDLQLQDSARAADSRMPSSG